MFTIFKTAKHSYQFLNSKGLNKLWKRCFLYRPPNTQKNYRGSLLDKIEKTYPPPEGYKTIYASLSMESLRVGYAVACCGLAISVYHFISFYNDPNLMSKEISFGLLTANNMELTLTLFFTSVLGYFLASRHVRMIYKKDSHYKTLLCGTFFRPLWIDHTACDLKPHKYRFAFLKNKIVFIHPSNFLNERDCIKLIGSAEL